MVNSLSPRPHLTGEDKFRKIGGDAFLKYMYYNKGQKKNCFLLAWANLKVFGNRCKYYHDNHKKITNVKLINKLIKHLKHGSPDEDNLLKTQSLYDNIIARIPAGKKREALEERFAEQMNLYVVDEGAEGSSTEEESDLGESSSEEDKGNLRSGNRGSSGNKYESKDKEGFVEGSSLKDRRPNEHEENDGEGEDRHVEEENPKEKLIGIDSQEVKEKDPLVEEKDPSAAHEDFSEEGELPPLPPRDDVKKEDSFQLLQEKQSGNSINSVSENINGAMAGEEDQFLSEDKEENAAQESEEDVPVNDVPEAINAGISEADRLQEAMLKYTPEYIASLSNEDVCDAYEEIKGMGSADSDLARQIKTLKRAFFSQLSLDQAMALGTRYPTMHLEIGMHNPLYRTHKVHAKHQLTKVVDLEAHQHRKDDEICTWEELLKKLNEQTLITDNQLSSFLRAHLNGLELQDLSNTEILTILNRLQKKRVDRLADFTVEARNFISKLSDEQTASLLNTEIEDPLALKAFVLAFQLRSHSLEGSEDSFFLLRLFAKASDKETKDIIRDVLIEGKCPEFQIADWAMLFRGECADLIRLLKNSSLNEIQLITISRMLVSKVKTNFHREELAQLDREKVCLGSNLERLKQLEGEPKAQALCRWIEGETLQSKNCRDYTVIEIYMMSESEVKSKYKDKADFKDLNWDQFIAVIERSGMPAKGVLVLINARTDLNQLLFEQARFLFKKLPEIERVRFIAKLEEFELEQWMEIIGSLSEEQIKDFLSNYKLGENQLFAITEVLSARGLLWEEFIQGLDGKGFDENLKLLDSLINS